MSNARRLARSLAAVGGALAAPWWAFACAPDRDAPRPWRPSLSLVRAADDTYTLYSVTPTTDACHRAGPVTDGPPDGSAAAPSELPLTLNVARASGGDCPRVVWPVYHVRRGITPGGRANLRVFALRNGVRVADAAVRFRDAIDDGAWTPELRALFPP